MLGRETNAVAAWTCNVRRGRINANVGAIVGVDELVILGRLLVNVVHEAAGRVGSGDKIKVVEEVAREEVLNKSVLGSADGEKASGRAERSEMHCSEERAKNRELLSKPSDSLNECDDPLKRVYE